MNARCGSHDDTEPATVGAGGRGGGICSAKPVATLGEFARSAAKRFSYDRIVLRSIPVARSISLGRPALQERAQGRLQMRLQGVHSNSPSREGGESNALPSTSAPAGRVRQPVTTLRSGGGIWVATGGEVWVAVGERVASRNFVTGCLTNDVTRGFFRMDRSVIERLRKGMALSCLPRR